MAAYLLLGFKQGDDRSLDVIWDQDTKRIIFPSYLPIKFFYTYFSVEGVNGHRTIPAVMPLVAEFLKRPA